MPTSDQKIKELEQRIANLEVLARHLVETGDREDWQGFSCMCGTYNRYIEMFGERD